MELIRRAAPSLPIHGSTQMSITSREGARFAAELGVSRVVVGRELSIQEIARMRQQKPPAAAAAVAAAAAQPAAAASAGGAAAQPAAPVHPLEAAGVAVAVEGVGSAGSAQVRLQQLGCQPAGSPMAAGIGVTCSSSFSNV